MGSAAGVWLINGERWVQRIDGIDPLWDVGFIAEKLRKESGAADLPQQVMIIAVHDVRVV